MKYNTNQSRKSRQSSMLKCPVQRFNTQISFKMVREEPPFSMAAMSPPLLHSSLVALTWAIPWTGTESLLTWDVFPLSLDSRLLNWDLFLRFCDPWLLSRKTWRLILWMLEAWCLSKPKVRYWFWQGIFIIMRKNFMIVRCVMGSWAAVFEVL